ncbi:hypothetical protein EWM64_g6855 [Hericium alpestre]|uniref:Uncharacterized protein n=1 Tax=Hericium alpestre TaxID=135208 RepID=A0A4Y9ZSX3_9AGAM|nr:hypothetical protein EWM64_g6855 [Hericium alpestre]
MAGISWHYVLKFIITGDAAVGKSSLLIRLTDQRFLANPDPTLGVEFGSKLITIPEENKVVKLQLPERALMARDVRAHADPHLTCILVGNKVDLCADDGARRQVSTDEAEIWAREEGLLFVEASAKSGQNVDAAFEEACRDILEKIRRGVFDDDRSPGVKLSKPAGNGLTLDPPTHASSSCCGT